MNTMKTTDEEMLNHVEAMIERSTERLEELRAHLKTLRATAHQQPALGMAISDVRLTARFVMDPMKEILFVLRHAET